MAIKLINMICSCCGKECPNLKQWHNRDNGFSICRDCIHWLKKRGESDESLKHDYGIAGIHYEDANAGVTVITPKGTSKVKGGLTTFVDMGDDSHIENHVSPNCKKYDEMVK